VLEVSGPLQQDLLATLGELDDAAVRRIIEQGDDERDIQLEFERFHARHPEVLDALVLLLRRARDKGFRRMGIGACFEILRWESGIGDERGIYKLNNNLRSRYARLIKEREPQLGQMLETRRLRS
jgi:hypothetical protein